MPYLANNPGDLVYDSFAIAHGAIGYIIGEGGVHLAVFPDEATGFQAYYASLGTQNNATPSSFANIKNLRFILTLAGQNAQFSSNGQSYNTVTLEGLRSSVFIDNAGGAMMGTLKAQIYGVTASDMNTLTSTLWDNLVISPSGSSFGFNTIQVFAIDGAQETLVYNGDVLNCWGVYTSMPDAYLYVEAQIGYSNLVQPTTPFSIATDTDVATVMQQIATKMGYQFENNGVNIPVAKGSYWGNTLMEQARSLMQTYKFWMYLENTSPNTLAIAPYGSARNVAAPLISPQTGLQGYPVFNSTGVNFETLFNPDVTFGGPIQVSSSIPKANGTWVVVSMSHQLSSQTPGGAWKTTVNAVSPTTGAAYVGQ